MSKSVNFDNTSNFHRYMPQWLEEYCFGCRQICIDIIDNLMLLCNAISNLFFLYAILGTLLYIYLVKFSQPHTQEKMKKRVLFVIAHPDDECMFFGPAILAMKNSNDVYILCLSIGNHYNLGSVRKEELYKSCKALGIPKSNVMIMNDSRMPDNPKIIWNAKRTAKILLDHIESLSIEEVYTFDNNGVSGHSNHISIFYGIAHLSLTKDLPSDVKVFLLESVNKLRKFSLFFDAAVSAFPFGENLFIASFSESNIIREAMCQHQSQLVWYRTIYIYLSRYMYINTFKELEQEDVELVLQMSDYNPFL